MIRLLALAMRFRDGACKLIIIWANDLGALQFLV